MRKIAIAALIAAQVASPVGAAELVRDSGAQERRMGAFAGATLRISLDAEPRERVRGGLSLSPTMHDVRSDGTARLRIGEGLQFGFGERRAPALTLAGQPVSRIVQGGSGPQGDRRNVSTLGWVAIGVGVVVVGVVGYGLWLNHELSNNEGD
jgi:hypothetical protein